MILLNITDQLDPNLDWSTFELGDIQFGDYRIPIVAAGSHYAGRADLRPYANDLFVDVVADLDKTSGLVHWTLTGIDPATGELSQDPTDGFLPPNDPATHSGEGFVSYTIRPGAGLASGTTISNMATIIFDWNEPMDTPLVTNRIDGAAPASQVAALSAQTGTANFAVSWSGSDDANGAGVATYDVYVSDNGGPATLWLDHTSSASATYPGVFTHSYAFYSIATDYVGHREAAPATPDAQTTLVAPPTDISLSQDGLDEAQPVGTLVGTLTTTDADPGDTFTYSLVAGPGDADNGSFKIVGGQLQTNAVLDFETQASYSIRVRSTDSGGLWLEKVFTINLTNVAPTATINQAAGQADPRPMRPSTSRCSSANR